MNSVKRLYQGFIPSHYDLTLDIDITKKSFHGKVIIEGIKKGRPSNRITFHQKDLKVNKAKITSLAKEPKEFTVDRINNHRSYDEVRLHCSELLYPGKYRVEIEYSGTINNQLNGIYLSYPKNGEQDSSNSIVATQFESHHAREAFVCIDEPEAKATFNLTLSSESKKAVLSNTEIKSQSVKNGRTVTEFQTTPIMSSYLLAFVIGDLEYLETKTNKGVVVRTYATKELIANTSFALETASKILEFYEDYFDIAYPLSKCDFIALPDFASGAMENWGCITFRDQALLVDKHSSNAIIQYVANVIAHELTHQWFGNLVTMKWWTDLWLNESFASWMSYLGVDHLHKEWDVWTQFINDEQTPVLKLDGLENTHPIEVPIHHPDEIRTIFDLISYEKGASVILMLESYLGSEVFKNGIRKYLKDNAYKNTETKDLWDALSSVSNINVSEIMHKWITLEGYPILSVSKISDTEIKLNQERFSYLKTTNSHIWPIPFSVKNNKWEIFETREKNLKIVKPILLNSGLRGYYRTIYSDDYIIPILSNIESINEIDRLGILRDAFAAACSGQYSTVEVLKLLKYYKDEHSLVVWEVISSLIANIRHIVADKELRELIKPYIKKIIDIQLNRLTWDEKQDDSYFDKLLRPIILSLASISDDKIILNKINKAFKDRSKTPIKGDYRGFIYSTIARNGSQKEFDELTKLHQTTKSPEEKLQLAMAITNFKEPKVYRQALAYIRSDHVRTQDSMYFISGSMSNLYSREDTWRWIKDNWKWLKETQGNDLSFYRIPNIVAANISDLKFLDDYREFFDSKMNNAFNRPIKQGTETIKWQSAWKSRDLKSIKAWFHENS